MRKKAIILSALVLVLIVIDQIIKISIKTNFCLHESMHITDWFYLSFIENNGMAYGMSFIPKYALSIFRLAACCVLVWYIRRQLLAGARVVWVVLLSVLLAGAAGNLIDCMFYGMIFEESTPWMAAQFVDFGTGYSSFLQGKVVDMFYFPLIVARFPDWLPIWGGQPFVFFSPIFNFADACVSVSVIAILIFCRKEINTIGQIQTAASSVEQEKPND